VTELRFHRDLYRGESIDEAVKVFAKFGTFALREDTTHWIVDVGAASSAREARVAGELGNYALGLTLKARK